MKAFKFRLTAYLLLIGIFTSIFENENLFGILKVEAAEVSDEETTSVVYVDKEFSLEDYEFDTDEENKILYLRKCNITSPEVTEDNEQVVYNLSIPGSITEGTYEGYSIALGYNERTDSATTGPWSNLTFGSITISDDVIFCKWMAYVFSYINCNSIDLGTQSEAVRYYYYTFESTTAESIDVTGLNTSDVVWFAYMFERCKNLTDVDVSSFDTSTAASFSSMFAYCSSLETVDVSGFDTSKNLSFANMFNGCSKLTFVDTSNWNTSSTTALFFMFKDCSSLTSVDTSNWDTSKVTSLTSIFQGCSSLTSVDVSGWNTSNVTGMKNAFYNCSSLADIDVSGWNTSNVTAFAYMFGNCSNLTSLDVSNWDISNVTDLSYMFYGDKNLDGLDVSGWDTSNVVSFEYAFYQCNSLSSLDVSNWNTSSATTLRSTFRDCLKLTTLDVSNWDVSHVYWFAGAFNGCKGLTSLDVSNWNVSHGITFNTMFNNCAKLTTLDVSNWDMSSAENIGYMFNVCSSLTSLDVSNWNTSNVTIMLATFHLCSKITSLDLSNWDTSGVTSAKSMFQSCYALKSINLDGLCTSSMKDISYMFSNCTSLEYAALGNWDTSNITTTSHMFEKCIKLTEISSSELWNTSKLTDMSYMYSGCSLLTSCGFGCSDFSHITTVSHIYEGCVSMPLEAWFSGGFSFPSLTDMSGAFKDCTNLINVDFSRISISKLTNISEMFSGCTNLKTLKMNGITLSSTANSTDWLKNVSLELLVSPDVVNCSAALDGSLYQCLDDGTLSTTAATTMAGNNAYYVLSDHVHSETVTYTEGTCTTKGYYTHTCGTCGFSWKVETDYKHTYSYEYTVDVEATCTTAGSKSRHCTSCDAKTDVTEIPATGHTASDWVIASESDCVNSGSKYKKCLTCGDILETAVIDATGHTAGSAVTENVVAASCTSKGSYDTVVYCKDCGAELSRVTTETEMLSHTESAWIIDLEPTCIAKGSKHKECTVCGKVLETEEIAETGHTESAIKTENRVEATCTVDGGYDLVTYCETCGEELSRNHVVLEKTGHTESDWIVSKNATCTEAGAKYKKCSVCGEILVTEEIAALGHTSGETVTENRVESTCSSTGGYDEVTYCTTCGEELSRIHKSIAKKSHTESEWIVSKNATCTENGSKYKKCSVCGEILETKEIEATGHTSGEIVVENAKESTCSKGGTYDEVTYCTTCGEELSRNTKTVAKKEHVSSDWIIDSEATCTTDGSKHKECLICGEILETKEIKATGHTEKSRKENEVEATCSHAGSYDFVVYCSACGEEISRVSINVPKLSHSESDWIIDSEETCTENGSKHKECTVCGEILETEVIDALGHTVSSVKTENRVEATCTVDGGYDLVTYCETCGEELSREHVVLPKTGHTESDWIISKEPTCSEAGSKYKKCSVCGEITETKSIEPLGHTLGDAVIENSLVASCTQGGSYDEVIYCTTCGEEVSRTTHTIEKNEHVLSDWIIDSEPTCTECGLKHKSCLLCGQTIETANILPTGHTAGEIVIENATESTCSMGGSYDEVTYCSVCGEELSCTTKTVAKKEHVSSDWIIDSEATCTTDGSKHKECLICGEILETKGIKATGHTEKSRKENEVEATCSHAGSYDFVVYCSTCGEEISRVSINVPKLSHTESDWIIDREPSCTTSGSKHKECSVCGEVLETKDIEAKGHTSSDTIIENEVEASCISEGSYDEVIYCDDCGIELSRNTVSVPKTSHTSSDWILDTDSSCLEKGRRHKECSLCGEILEQEELDELGHVESNMVVENTVDATIEQEGGYDEVNYCSVCGEELSRNHVVIPKLNIAPSIENVVGPDTISDEANKTNEVTNNSNSSVNETPVIEYKSSLNENLNSLSESVNEVAALKPVSTSISNTSVQYAVESIAESVNVEADCSKSTISSASVDYSKIDVMQTISDAQKELLENNSDLTLTFSLVVKDGDEELAKAYTKNNVTNSAVIPLNFTLLSILSDQNGNVLNEEEIEIAYPITISFANPLDKVYESAIIKDAQSQEDTSLLYDSSNDSYSFTTSQLGDYLFIAEPDIALSSNDATKEAVNQVGGIMSNGNDEGHSDDSNTSSIPVLPVAGGTAVALLIGIYVFARRKLGIHILHQCIK